MVSLEYFLGSFLSFALIFALSKKMVREQTVSKKFISRQSMSIKARKTTGIKREPVKSRQSHNHFKKTNVRVLIMNDRAFWIKDNAVYTADVDGDEVVKSSAVQVDIIGMNKVELDKMMFIIDKLTERQQNDSRGSGF